MKGRLLAVGALLFALFGCSSAPNGDLAGNLPDADPSALQRRPQPQGATAQASLASAGLTQAPTAQQVIESFPEGRLDPFGPIPAPLAAAQAQAPTPAKIREMLGNFAVLVCSGADNKPLPRQVRAAGSLSHRANPVLFNDSLESSVLPRTRYH